MQIAVCQISFKLQNLHFITFNVIAAVCFLSTAVDTCTNLSKFETLIRSHFINLLLPGSTEPCGSMSGSKGNHHTVPDQISEWVCCVYWECEHCQVHSWEVQLHIWATLKFYHKLWQCVSGCWECGGSGSCKNMHSTTHQWVTTLLCVGRWTQDTADKSKWVHTSTATSLLYLKLYLDGRRWGGGVGQAHMHDDVMPNKIVWFHALQLLLNAFV